MTDKKVELDWQMVPEGSPISTSTKSDEVLVFSLDNWSQVGLSGILMVKGTSYVHMNQVNQQENLFGTLLSENVIGVIHDHYVAFYLDMDVDAPIIPLWK